jgi:hypothetical protein
MDINSIRRTTTTAGRQCLMPSLIATSLLLHSTRNYIECIVVFQSISRLYADIITSIQIRPFHSIEARPHSIKY